MFDIIVERFEQYISEYSYECYRLGSQELVYDIQNSIIIHVSIRSENYNRIVFEEIFNEGIYDLKLKHLEKQPEGYLVQVFKFYGTLGYSDYYVRSRYERVNEQLPELELDKRYEQWPGFSVPHLVFELTEGGRTGYAINRTKAKQTMKRVISVGEDLLFACINAESLRMYKDESVEYFNGAGNEYYFTLDRTFVEIIMNRLRGKSQNWKERRKAPGQIGIEEEGLKFCWINARMKAYSYMDGKVISDIKSGCYDDIDRYEFVLPENKWKSEQLVYELVKQLYPKGNVWYQYRPDFLFSGKGQLSYDVYIGKLRIAIEYQGKQHFEPVDIFGGEDSFKKQKERDRIKADLSKAYGIKLVYINYWEDLSSELVKRKIDEALSLSN